MGNRKQEKMRGKCEKTRRKCEALNISISVSCTAPAKLIITITSSIINKWAFFPQQIRPEIAFSFVLSVTLGESVCS